MPSMIFKEIAFLHFRKTGGSWVSHVLKDLDFKRIDEKEFHVSRDKVDNKFFTFGFVRHPVDWYKSFYKFLNFTKYEFNPDLVSQDINGLINKLKTNKFSVKSFQEEFNNFFCIGKENECNFIGKYENLYEDLKRVLAINNINANNLIDTYKTKLINNSQYSDCKISEENLKYIYSSCHKIMKRFNYEIL